VVLKVDPLKPEQSLIRKACQVLLDGFVVARHIGDVAYSGINLLRPPGVLVYADNGEAHLGLFHGKGKPHVAEAHYADARLPALDLLD